MKTEAERRAQLRKFFHAVIVEVLADWSGHSHEDVKNELRKLFCPDQFDEDGALLEPIDRETEKLTLKQYSDFVWRSAAFCAHQGLILPEKKAATARPTAAPKGRP